jgi:hypothetical protein
MGFLELYLIYDEGGVWEQNWRPLQGNEIASLLTTVPKDTIEHALRGWTSPLVKSLGLPPQGALIKLPESARVCTLRDRCPFYDKARCFPTAKRMPWCYEPDGSEDPEVRRLMSEIVKSWREGVYVVLVQEEHDAQRDRRH